MSRAIPATADVVVVGGGILGCAAAWHIRRSTDLSVVVIERMGLGAAATSHAAGLLNRFGATDAVMSLVDRTYAALAELGDILEERLPLVETGTLHLAASEASRANLRAATATAVSHGLRVEHPSRETIEQCLPWLDAGLIREGAFAVDDGFIDPYALAAAYARAARTLGATVASGVAVDGILARSGRVSGVATSAGRIEAPVVIAAAGAWSNTLLAPLGAFVPTAPVRSHYWITDLDSLFPDRHPVAFLPDARAYTRPELGALLFGLRDRTSVCADPTALPRDVSGFAFDEDPDGGRALEEGFPDLVRFIPALGRAGIAHYVCGLSDYTPDGLPVVGPLEGAEGLIAVAGCGAGIAISGGVGLAAAELAAGGEPSLDISAFDPGRFGAVDPFDPAFRRRCAAARSRKGQDRELTDY